MSYYTSKYWQSPEEYSVIYVLCSAFLFILGQIGWSCSVLCAVLWIVPLLLQARVKQLTFFQGFFWGLIVFSFHLSWILVTLWHHGAGWMCIVLWILTVLWFSASSGIWMYATRYSWIFSTILFFLFLIKLSLLVWGRCEGYPLLNPLLPFSDFFKRDIRLEDEKVIFIQPWWYGHKNPMFVGYRIADSIGECTKNNSCVRTIIMPESTFCFDLHEFLDFVKIWSYDYEKVLILLGTHRKLNDGYLNSIVVICDGKIIQIYDKNHFMPFVESAPWGLNLFGQKNSKVTTEFNDIVMIGEKKYQIFICSELFFESKSVKGLPILMLWNDTWLKFGWVKKLAIRYIDYFACKHQVPIFHASTLGMTNIKNDL